MPNNPVINKFGTVARANPPDLSTNDLNAMFDKPAYSGPRGASRYMTLDDVVQRTGAMLLVVLASGAVSWGLVTTKAAGPVILVGALGGVALGLYMSFTMRVNAALALVYAAFEGTFLGAVSRIFNDRWPGIVIQAVAGTVAVAGGMLFVYRIGAIRVTPRFTRIVVGATIGVFGLMLINLVAYLFHPGGLGLRTGGAVAVIFSLLCIVIAAMNLVMDFDMVERGIRQGADEKFAWYAAFGLTVTLIWLYLEILRLLSYLRD
ncbi:MAG: Bax inhibitor-1/YccA family protein [Solirubrobacteraceae bacterium]